LDFFAATSSSKGVGDNGGVIGMSSSKCTLKKLQFFPMFSKFMKEMLKKVVDSKKCYYCTS
jgi:hypothetical protein